MMCDVAEQPVNRASDNMTIIAWVASQICLDLESLDTRNK